ncbi:hypothetical protein QTH91_07720 [Variovorax dokdonensis]|uniref:Uncharacterized protein n=1 Tax=Variovorax dokdonensis TaxID=344883 RepID=A0ABT7N8V2_9BURK|nr:hypothetical protein [Variovorax dokdonensis]MDM0044362.1 hypothetical protein [Variovorax dokdonensis]
MNEEDIAASIERLMARVDYYLHCELDEEYDHDRPDSARKLLEIAIRHELLRANAIGIVSNVVTSASEGGPETR